MVRNGAAAAAGFALVVLLASCGAGSDAVGPAAPTGRPEKDTVILRDIAFKPDKLTVKVGDTVTWKFEDQGISHDVVADDERFKSEIRDSGVFRHTFDTPGTYPYKCTLHPVQMTGTITVRPA